MRRASRRIEAAGGDGAVLRSLDDERRVEADGEDADGRGMQIDAQVRTDVPGLARTDPRDRSRRCSRHRH